MKRKSRSSKSEAKPARPVPEDRALYWRYFFNGQRCPVLRSQLVTALMAGTQLEVDRLPHAVLADAVLLSLAARAYHNAEIVDDYMGLLDRTNEVWRAPEFTHKVFDQTHLSTVSFIARGSTEFRCVEDQYVPVMVGWYLTHEAPSYFKKELT
jgi:hypothetical protein